MPRYYDTILWEYIKKPWNRGLSLDNLAEKLFDYKMISYKEITDKEKIPFKDLDLQKAANYSAEDVYITNKLFEKQKSENITNEKVLNEIELALLEVIKDMELNGVKIDFDFLKELWKKLENEKNILSKEIFREAWKEINLNSPKQVAELLFVDLWLPSSKKTKTWYSVDTEVLETLSFEYKIAKDILEYRKITKLLSTYINWLPKYKNNKTNKIHSSFNQTITSTGRLSSSDPNLQNIPVWDGIWWKLREAFIAEDDESIIVAADYSQVEIRLLAIMAWDENLIWAFKAWADIHSTTANFIFWTDDISKDQRKIAKAVNFWVIYGISAFWLAKMIGISQKEARVYIEKFYEKYPKVREFFNNIIDFCKENGYTQTLYSRKRYIESINDSNSIKRKQAERECINMPIQWTNADIIKLAMIKINDFIKNNKLKSKMIMQVHDELVFNVKIKEKEILEKKLKEIMENILIDTKELRDKYFEIEDIKLKVDFWEWKNWREAH